MRPQRHHAVVAGGHQRGRKYCVKILNLASAATGSSATQLAMHLGRAMKLGAVQRDQASPAQPAKRLQSSRLLSQHRQCRVKHSVERLRRNPVQTLANVVVAQNPSHPEQRGRTAVAIAALSHSPLVRQKRWRLHEEHRKGRHGNVAEAILRVPAAARVLSCSTHRRILPIKISTIGFMAASYITINPKDQVSYLVVFIHLFFIMRIAVCKKQIWDCQMLYNYCLTSCNLHEKEVTLPNPKSLHQSAMFCISLPYVCRPGHPLVQLVEQSLVNRLRIVSASCIARTMVGLLRLKRICSQPLRQRRWLNSALIVHIRSIFAVRHIFSRSCN